MNHSLPDSNWPPASHHTILASGLLAISASSLVSLATVAGNVLVLIAFIVERSIRTPSNLFIVSLAITDLLIGAVSMNLYTVYLVLGYWPLSPLLCDLWLSLDYTACLTSQYTVLFITVDRYCSVTVPAAYRAWRSPRKVLAMVSASWAIPASLFFTSILGWPHFTYNSSLEPGTRLRDPRHCYAEFTTNVVFNTLLTIAYFWITLVAMCILYAGIYRVAKRLQLSSERRRGMSTLFAMAGQTMSRIGVGVSWHNKDDNEDNDEDRLAPQHTVSFREPSESPPPLPPPSLSATAVAMILPSSPYKLNATPDNVRLLPFIDDASLLSGEVDDDDDDDDEMELLRMEPGLAEILPLHTVSSPTSALAPVSASSSGGPQKTVTIKERTLSHKRSKRSHSSAKKKPGSGRLLTAANQNGSSSQKSFVKKAVNLQRLQLSRFAFLNPRKVDTAEVRSRNRARKALRTISLILGAFVTCWTPYHILVLVKGFCDRAGVSSCVNSHLYNLSYWLCYMNSPINPFCYALANAQIKKTFHRILHGDFRRHS